MIDFTTNPTGFYLGESATLTANTHGDGSTCIEIDLDAFYYSRALTGDVVTVSIPAKFLLSEIFLKSFTVDNPSPNDADCQAGIGYTEVGTADYKNTITDDSGTPRLKYMFSTFPDISSSGGTTTINNITSTSTVTESPAQTFFNGFVIFLMFAAFIIWVFRPKSN